MESMLDRRTLLAAVAGTGVAGFATYTLLSPEAEPARPSVQQLPGAIEADTVRRSFGVNTHLTRTSSPYAATPAAGGAVVELMDRLGAAYWRERAAVEDPLQTRAAQDLASIGCRQVATIGALGDSVEVVSSTVRQLAESYGADVRAVVAAVAGANEPNASGGDWVAGSLLHQQAVFEQTRSLPSLDDAFVLASGLKGDLSGAVAAMRALAETSYEKWADVGNIHHYTAGQVPTLGLDDRLAAAAAVVGDKPVWCTEIGYVDWLGHGPGNPVPPDVYAAYMPRALIEMVRRGVPAMIKYELLDDLDRADTWEGHFGLVYCPSNDPELWEEKPAFATLRRLLQMTGDEGPAFSPRPLPGMVTGDVSSMVLAKRNGSYVVLLWRDVSLYDVTAEESTPVAPITATLTLPSRRPLAWSAMNSASTSRPVLGAEIRVPVAGDVVAVTVGPNR
ncbi:MAG: hypothetical protein H0V49_05380 [Nocardioidaceae bacterium]|nr:hypothetical protein [Nocardioidaceae bacterium]